MRTPLGHKWLRAHALPNDKGDDKTYWTGLLTDITLQKQTEKNLTKEAKLLQTVMQIAPAGIFQANAAGDCNYVNKRWGQISGISAKDAAGTGWIAAIHPDGRKHVVRDWLKAVKTTQPFEFKYRFLNANNATTWSSVRLKPS